MVNTAKTSRALVLCGGASHGAIEVGFYKAIVDLNIKIDFVVGCSIGAINGAIIASGLSSEYLERLWSRASKMNLFSLKGTWWNILRKKSGLSDSKNLEKVLNEIIPVKQFENLKKPLIVVATDLQTGEAVLFNKGNLIEAIMASCSIPGLFPPRFFQNRWLVDGAVSANMPIFAAEQFGATEIITFPCRCETEKIKMPISSIKVLLKCLSILMKTQEECHIQLAQSKTKVIVVPPCPGIEMGRLDFDHAHKLIDFAYKQAFCFLSSYFKS